MEKLLELPVGVGQFVVTLDIQQNLRVIQNLL